MRNIARRASRTQAVPTARGVANIARHHQQQSSDLRKHALTVEEHPAADDGAALPPAAAEQLPAQQRTREGPPREHLSEPAGEHERKSAKYSAEVEAEVLGVDAIDDLQSGHREQHHSAHASRPADADRVAEERDDYPGGLVEALQGRGQELRDFRLLQVQSEVSAAAAAAEAERRLLTALTH